MIVNDENINNICNIYRYKTKKYIESWTPSKEYAINNNNNNNNDNTNNSNNINIWWSKISYFFGFIFENKEISKKNNKNKQNSNKKRRKTWK